MSIKKIKLAVCQNPVCGLEFRVGPGSRGVACSNKCAGAICSINRQQTKKIRDQQKLNDYLRDPKLCCCGEVISFKNKKGKFCSHSCSAKNSNILRPKRVVESHKNTKRQYIRKCSSKSFIAEQYRITEYSWSKIYKSTCKHCNLKFISKTPSKYCSTHFSLYRAKGKNRFKFTFKIEKYPDIFDLENITKVGFYNPRSKRDTFNPNGLARDHKVSVTDAIRFNYDPYYIKHPLNCEIMLQSDNIKKYNKSSITYEQLVYLVDNYQEKMEGVVRFELTT